MEFLNQGKGSRLQRHFGPWLAPVGFQLSLCESSQQICGVPDWGFIPYCVFCFGPILHRISVSTETKNNVFQLPCNAANNYFCRPQDRHIVNST